MRTKKALENELRIAEQRIKTYQQRIARGLELEQSVSVPYRMGWKDALNYAARALAPPPITAPRHARQVSIVHASNREEKSE